MLLQPPINESSRTIPMLGPRTAWRLRGNAKSRPIPRKAMQAAAMNHGNSGPRDGRFGAPIGGAVLTVAANRLAGTVTVNVHGGTAPVQLSDPAFCVRAVLMPAFAPDCGVQMISEFASKLLPVTVSVALLPAVIEPGVALVKPGTGASIPKFSEFCAPVMLTATSPALASAEAGTLTVICVLVALVGVN